MFNVLRIAALGFLIHFASFTNAEPLTSAQMEKTIVGAWTEKIEMDGVVATGISRYASDNTVVHTGSIVAGDFKVQFRFRSRWRIEKDVLVTEVLETNQPEIVAVGDVERDTILSMSNEQWKYRESDGNVVTAFRLHEPSPN